MASWNGQNKRRKKDDFSKKRKLAELQSLYVGAENRQRRKRDRRFEESIVRELAEDALLDELEEMETVYLVRKHSQSN